MRALVVFESIFGNTQEVAQAISVGLSMGGDIAVDIMEVGIAPETLGTDVGLLVIGGPTQAFGMSRSSTRDDARLKAGPKVVSAGIGVREWIERLAIPVGVAAATFDTRINKPRVPGSAAKGAHRRLDGRGLEMIAPAESFWVTGTSGPLEAGEIDRARSWGAELGRLARTTGRATDGQA